MNDHPITPPPELVEQWFDASVLEGAITYDEFNFANLAARWGADMELEACCEWLREFHQSKRPGGTENLRRSRRPKPPSLKEQALEALQFVDEKLDLPLHNHCNAIHTIRRALEALDD
jgi:hypothetical protein